MVYGYIRVSTDKQTVENQRFEIVRFVRRMILRSTVGSKRLFLVAKLWRSGSWANFCRKCRREILLSVPNSLVWEGIF